MRIEDPLCVPSLTDDDIITMRDKFGARSLCGPLVTSPTFAVINIVCRRRWSGRPAAALLGPKESGERGQNLSLDEQVLALDHALVDHLLVVGALLDAGPVDEERVAGGRRCEMKRLLRCFSRWERGFLSVMMGLWYTAESKDR